MIQAFISSLLFAIGLYGLLVRRDIVAVLSSVEVMLGGALVLLVAMGARSSAPQAVEAIALLVLVVAAAEAAVGLALLAAVARTHKAMRIDELTEVKG